MYSKYVIPRASWCNDVNVYSSLCIDIHNIYTQKRRGVTQRLKKWIQAYRCVCVCVCVCVFDCVGVDKKSHSNDSVTSHVASTRENCMVNGNEI